MRLLFAILLLGAALPSRAQDFNPHRDLPETPAPKFQSTAMYPGGRPLDVAQRSFWSSRVIKVEAVAMFGMGAWDKPATSFVTDVEKQA
jgi:hypothetical protein